MFDVITPPMAQSRRPTILQRLSRSEQVAWEVRLGAVMFVAGTTLALLFGIMSMIDPRLPGTLMSLSALLTAIVGGWVALRKLNISEKRVELRDRGEMSEVRSQLVISRQRISDLEAHEKRTARAYHRLKVAHEELEKRVATASYVLNGIELILKERKIHDTQIDLLYASWGQTTADEPRTPFIRTINIATATAPAEEAGEPQQAPSGTDAPRAD